MKRRWPDFNLTRDADYILRGIPSEEILKGAYPSRPNSRILEVGCGSGKFGLSYALEGHVEVTLMDIDPDALAYSQKLYRLIKNMGGQFKGRVYWTKGSAFDIPFCDNRFHFVYCEQVLHQWGYKEKDWRPQKAIREMARVTSLVVCVIVPDATDLTTIEWEKQLDRNKHPSTKCYTPKELVNLMDKAGLTMSQLGTVKSMDENGGLIGGIGWKSA